MEVLDCRKQMTSHLRSRIAALGIKARVSQCPSSKFGIMVSVPKYDTLFTAQEQHAIKSLALANGLTAVRGTLINLDHYTDAKGLTYTFYLTESCIAEWRERTLRWPNASLRLDAQPKAI